MIRANIEVRRWDETNYLKRQAIANAGRGVSIREGQPLLVATVE